MSYFDHILCFENEAAAKVALPALCPEGIWDARWVTLVQLHTAFDVIGAEDPVTTARPVTTPGACLPGFWLMVSLPAEDVALKASGACRLIASRALWREQSPFGFLTQLNWDAAEFASVLRFTPQIAGVGYPMGASNG